MKPGIRCVCALVVFYSVFHLYAPAQTGISLPQQISVIDQYDSVFFDLTQAACSAALAQFPVFIKTDDPVYSLDFSLKFDVTKMAFHSILIHQGYLMASASYNTTDSVLRFTSSSMTPIGNLVPLVSVRFTMLHGGQINASDIFFRSALLNGTSCSRRIIPGAMQPVLNPAGFLVMDPGDSITLSVSAPANSFYLWSTGATTNSVTAYISGTYSVTVTTQAGCSIFLNAMIQYTSPLPVSLIVFTAKLNALRKAETEWITASEWNNDFFTVERSADGIHFENIATVDGAGNSTQPLHYQWVDEHPLAGTSYYRLKQTDFDGNSSYSSLVSIRNFSISDTEVTLFPNPAGELITICINDASPDCFYRADLIDVTGKVVMRMDMEGPEQRMDISHVTAGTYFIRVAPFASVSDSKEIMQRIVVMR